MKIVEFIAAPCSGKTYIYNLISKKLKKKNFFFFSYKTAFFKFVFKEKLKFFEILILLYFKYIKLKNKKDYNNQNKIVKKKFILKNIFFLNFSNFLYSNYYLICEKFCKKFNNNIKREIFEILKFNKNKIDNKNRNSLKWFNEFFAFMYIVKKNQKDIDLLIDDEGYIQKIFIFSDLKFNKKFTKSFLSLVKDNFFIINIKSSKKIIFKRSNLRKETKFKYEDYTHLNKVMEFQKQIIKLLKNKNNFFQFKNDNKIDKLISNFIKTKKIFK